MEGATFSSYYLIINDPMLMVYCMGDVFYMNTTSTAQLSLSYYSIFSVMFKRLLTERVLVSSLAHWHKPRHFFYSCLIMLCAKKILPLVRV